MRDDDADPDYAPYDDSSDDCTSNWNNPPFSSTDEVQRSGNASSTTDDHDTNSATYDYNSNVATENSTPNAPPGFEHETSLQEPVIATVVPVVAPEGHQNENSNNNVSISE